MRRAGLVGLVVLTACEGASPIDAHLERTLARLEAADVSHLSDVQADARAEGLTALREYIDRGEYPHNHVHEAGRTPPAPVDGGFETDGRTPVFVDEHGTHCAVAAMIAASGHDDLVDAVVEAENTRFVHEMQTPGLVDWADDHGFTVDELAAIQPSYCHLTGDRPIPQEDWFLFTLLTTAGTGFTTVGAVQRAVDDRTPRGLHVGGALTGVGLLTHAWLAPPRVTPSKRSCIDFRPVQIADVAVGIPMIGVNAVFASLKAPVSVAPGLRRTPEGVAPTLEVHGRL